MYDPQLGKWNGVDPYDEFASPYIGMGSDPVNGVDPDGGSVLNFFDSPILNHFADAFGGALIGGIIGAIADKEGGRSDGALRGMAWGAGAGLAGSLGYSYIPWEDVGAGVSNAAQWVGNLFQSNNYWILYNGVEVITYRGNYNDLSGSKRIKEYAGTSGGEGYQSPQNQSKPEVGPVPEGDYSIDLRPSFTRNASVNTDGSTKPNSGVTLLPWENGSLYSGWGQWRAKLDKVKVNSTRDNFYFHDSYKGYSHGCIETSTALYYDLSHYKKAGQKSIKVKVQYSGSTTNGGTKQFPPPWWDGTPVRYYKGVPFPKPAIGSFPDKKRM